MNVLKAYAIFYWSVYFIGWGALGTWFWNTYPTYAPFVVVPFGLAFVTKKIAEYMIFKQKLTAVQNALDNYQHHQAHSDFDTNDTDQKNGYMN